MTYRAILLVLFLNFTIAKSQLAAPPIVPPYNVILSGMPASGFLFTSPVNMITPTPNWPSTLTLHDSAGVLVFYMPITPDSIAPFTRTALGNFQLHSDGRMSFTDKLFGLQGAIYMMDSTFTITDTITCSPQYELDGHDFFITSDGHYHLLAMEERIMDASGLITESGQQGDTSCVVIGHIIQEFDQNKILVNEWKVLDNFALSDIYPYYFTDPTSVDLAHINSLFIDHNDNYVISSRSLNEVTSIDRQTGQVLWRLGGKNNQFTFIGDTVQFIAQHDAQYYSDGRLVLFDNATFTFPNPVARNLVYQLDDINMTVTSLISFQHPLNFNCGFMGSTRILDQNHIMTSWGGGWNYNLGANIQEFDQALNEVMNLDYNNGFVSYRALKYNLPWTLNRPELVCNEQQKTLTAPGNKDSYYWNTGDTTQSITITSIGTYQVWTNYGDGFISSEPYEIIDLNDICPPTVGVEEYVLFSLKVYPSPSSDIINLEWNNNIGTFLIEIYDLSGKKVISKKANSYNSKETINISELPPGIYNLKLTQIQSNQTTSAKFSVIK